MKLFDATVGRIRRGSVVLCVLIAALTAFHTARMHSGMIRDQNRAVESLTRVVANDLNRTLQRFDARLSEIAREITVGVDSHALHALLTSSLANDRLLREVAVVGPGLRVIASTNRASVGASADPLVKRDGEPVRTLAIGAPVKGRTLASLDTPSAGTSAFIPFIQETAVDGDRYSVVAVVGIDNLMNEISLLTGDMPVTVSLYRYDGMPIAINGTVPTGATAPDPIFTRFLPRFEHGAFDTENGTLLAHFRTTADYPAIVELRTPYALVTASWLNEALIAFIPLAMSVAAVLFYTRLVHSSLQRSAAAEERAALQERRLRQVMDGAAEGIVTIGSDGTIRDYNRAAERIFGVPAAEALGAPLGTILPMELAGSHQGMVDRYLREGRSQVLGTGRRLRTSRRDGQPLTIMLSLSEVIDVGERLFTGIVHDVTPTEQAEERFRLLFDQSTAAHLIYDVDGIAACNRAAAELFGKARCEDLRGRRLLDVVDLDGAARSALATAERDAAEGSVQRISIPAHTHDGRQLVIDVSVTIVALDGRPVFLAVWYDATEQRRQAESLRAARDAAEAATEAKTRFLAIMSHELRTPMTGVLGMVELLKGSDLTASQTAHVETLERSARSLLTVLNDVLDFSKNEAGRLHLECISWSPTDLCADVVEFLRPTAAERGNRLELAVAHGVPARTVGDPTRVRQILVNLLGNAIKFTERGRIGLVVTVAPHLGEKGEIQLSFAVSDNGIGIPADRIGVLFRPFEQVDTATTRRFGGTGLGLAICRQLTEAMGGTITVESTLGVGSRFEVRLPVGSLGMANAAACPGTRSERAAAPLTLLLAEDNGVIRDLVTEKLTRMGHGVTAVPNGALAVEAARNQPYDAILLDMQMPVMDGLTAAAAIRTLGPLTRTVPIIALTADVFAGRTGEPRECLIDAFVTKPVAWGELAATLARLVHGEDSGRSAAAPAEPDRIAELRADIGDPVLTRILHSYVATGTDDLATCRAAIASDDATRLQQACHRFRGMASNLGFDTSAECAERLEFASPSDWCTLADALETRFAKDRRTVADILARMAPAVGES